MGFDAFILSCVAVVALWLAAVNISDAHDELTRIRMALEDMVALESDGD